MPEISDAVEDRLFQLIVELSDFFNERGFDRTALQLERALDTFLEERTRLRKGEHSSPNQLEKERLYAGPKPRGTASFRSTREFLTSHQELRSRVKTGGAAVSCANPRTNRIRFSLM